MAESPYRHLFLLLCCGLSLVPATTTRAGEIVSLDRAIAKSLERNGQMQAARHEAVAAQAELNQAAKCPNPELEVETENLGAASASLVVAQSVELGGKRKARIRIARADSSFAAAQLDIRRAAMVAETHRRFFRALGHQNQLEQIDSLILFAESIRTSVERQVEHGLAGKTELLRSIKDITLLRMERNTIVRLHENSLAALGALWGSAPGAIASVSGDLHFEKPPFTRDSLNAYLEQSPVMHAALAQVEAAKAKETASRAEGIPGFSVKGGYHRETEADDNRFVLGASMGLPLFNRNQGGVAAAKSRTAASDNRAEAVRNEIYTKLMQSFGEIDQLEFKAAELRDKVIPQTGEVLAEIRRLFEAGKSSYVDLITTQRELVAAWRDYLTAETEIRLALADIMELVGHN